jgi:hypothetical protein
MRCLIESILSDVLACLHSIQCARCCNLFNALGCFILIDALGHTLN